MIKDEYARECFKTNKNSVISWVISASYAYYILDRPLLSDKVFDGMCKYILANWDDLEHIHKHLINKEDMQNGSLYHLSMFDYPLRVQLSVEQMLNE